MRGTTFARRGATRLGDLARLSEPAQRTTAVRVGLALALAATLAGAILLARSAGSGRAAVLPVGTKTGVVVLDMSASVAGPTFERVGAVVRGLVAANQPVGLVMFSDVAYELLPPNSPPSALQQFVRFFTPGHVHRGAPIFGQSPWSQFSGGTRISTGLVARQNALRRAHIPHGSLVLMSDLNDSQDDQTRSSTRQLRSGRRMSRSGSFRSTPLRRTSRPSPSCSARTSSSSRRRSRRSGSSTSSRSPPLLPGH